MIRDCLCQVLNTNRIAMITALVKRFRNIQITLGRREDLKDSRESCWIQLGSELLVGLKGNRISHWFHWGCFNSLPLEALPHHRTYTTTVLFFSMALCPGFENWETETHPNANSHSHKVKLIKRNTKTVEHVNKPQQINTPPPQWKLNPVTC